MRRRPWLVLVCLPFALGVAACDAEGGSDAGDGVHARQTHLDGDGPLSAMSGAGGGVGLNPPAHSPWTGSFGVPQLCVTGSEPATLEDVRYHDVVAPISASTWLRRLPGEKFTGSGDPLPFHSKMGAAPFDGPGGDRLAGAWDRKVAGTMISESCESGDPTYELVTTLEVGASGAWIDHIYVDYTTDGRPYTLQIDWSYLGCGPETEEPCAG